MKKLYTAMTVFIVSQSFIVAQEQKNLTADQINQMMVSYHNNIFGVDYLFKDKINREKLTAWLSVGDEVSKYINTNSTDIFGSRDSTLIKSLDTIQKANKALTDAIEITYVARKNTPVLIKMAALFQSIETKVHKTIESLKGITFILKRKKDAQSLLINFALFIELTAKKANKDTRMGHRKDIAFPTVQPKKSMPPTDMPPIYIPEPPTDMPPVYKESTPPNRPLPRIPT